MYISTTSLLCCCCCTPDHLVSWRMCFSGPVAGVAGELTVPFEAARLPVSGPACACVSLVSCWNIGWHARLHWLRVRTLTRTHTHTNTPELITKCWPFAVAASLGHLSAPLAAFWRKVYVNWQLLSHRRTVILPCSPFPLSAILDTP